MPAIVAKSIAILSDAGLGMAMFSLGMLTLIQYLRSFTFFPFWKGRMCLFAGLFMALQPKIIACGNSVAVFAMAIRFIVGPAVMTAASMAFRIEGTLLHVAIVQVVPKPCIDRWKSKSLLLFWLIDLWLMLKLNRLLYLKELSLLCLLKSTMSIQRYLAQGEFLFYFHALLTCTS